MRSSRSRAAVALALLALVAVPAGARGDGASVYKASCALCHGDVPAPRFAGKSVDDVKAVIKAGKGRMRPVQLSPADADAVAGFTAGIPPQEGAPAAR